MYRLVTCRLDLVSSRDFRLVTGPRIFACEIRISRTHLQPDPLLPEVLHAVRGRDDPLLGEDGGAAGEDAVAVQADDGGPVAHGGGLSAHDADLTKTKNGRTQIANK